MRVTSISMSMFRSFDTLLKMDLNVINVLVGPNNSGKSTILRALYLMQDGAAPSLADIRAGATKSTIEIRFDESVSWSGANQRIEEILIAIEGDVRNPRASIISVEGLAEHGIRIGNGIGPRPAYEPEHFVVPFLAKRKVVGYSEDVRGSNSISIHPNMSLLSAKLARVANPAFPEYERYTEACKRILGFVVSAVPSDGGMRPGVYLPDKSRLYIDQMGEGVANIVGLLADLTLFEDKLFLIEEPENDLHPAALKVLLELIVDRSRFNQFIVSTHSNIVLRHLGGEEGSTVYRVTADVGLPTTSKVSLVGNEPRERLQVLRELGYSFSDMDLWDGWLILEESSAERIIRDYLIPWFAPKLSRIRTLAAGGVSEIEPTFNDFHRLVRFSHLEDAYRAATWVRVDGDEVGNGIVERLRQRYSTWDRDRFGVFSEPQFERYYPEPFQGRVAEVMQIPDKARRREEKRKLLEDVRTWIDSNIEAAKEALARSARDVISDLKTMEAAL